jgi:hypothetical protein
MVPKFKINDVVEVKIKNNFKRLQILDFEVFESVTLYYTDDGKAYPENVLNYVGTNGLRYFLSASTEQKDKDFLQILKDLKIDF